MYKVRQSLIHIFSKGDFQGRAKTCVPCHMDFLRRNGMVHIDFGKRYISVNHNCRIVYLVYVKNIIDWSF